MLSVTNADASRDDTMAMTTTPSQERIRITRRPGVDLDDGVVGREGGMLTARVSGTAAVAERV